MPIQCPQPECGALNQDLAKYCVNCGKPLQVKFVPLGPGKPPSPPLPPPPLPPARPPTGLSTGRKILLCLLAIPAAYLAVKFVGVAIFVLSGPQPLDALRGRYHSNYWVGEDPLSLLLVFLVPALLLICIIWYLARKRRSNFPLSGESGGDESQTEAQLVAKLGHGVRGVVTVLRPWNAGVISGGARQFDTATYEWILELRRTDTGGQYKRDDKGFLAPVVTVEYRTQIVHGASIEEGNDVFVKGHGHRNRTRATGIWNLSKVNGESVLGPLKVFAGRVLNWQPPRQVPDPLYPSQNRVLEVRNFRLQRIDSDNNLLPPLQVEMRAEGISGVLSDGEHVEIEGHLVKGILHASAILDIQQESGLIVKGLRGLV